MTALFFWVVIGGLIGGVAKSTVWFASSQGWTASVLFGAVGGILGGVVRNSAGPTDGFDLSTMGLVIVGAAAALSIYNLFAARGKASEISGHRKAA